LTTNFFAYFGEHHAWLHSRINVFGCQRTSRPEPRQSHRFIGAWWR